MEELFLCDQNPSQMKIFQCGNCEYPLFFENTTCENCGHLSGYRSEDRMMLTFNPTLPSMISDRENIAYRYCKNIEHSVCNWVLEITDPNDFCQACRLNRTIPNLSDKSNFYKWQNLEVAKHRLVYQLQKIGLNLSSKQSDENGVCFDFVAKQPNSNVMTGHANGIITILIREADSVFREQTRIQLQEPYRTLIGHLRHEVGHYFWERLVLSNAVVLDQFRTIFGNDEVNYSEALKTYYKNGPPNDWQESFISKYATSHPWEDWAETWAHYLHIMDMLETAHFFGLTVKPTEVLKNQETTLTLDPYAEPDFGAIIGKSGPLTFAVNSINRSMGLPDVYPFVISQPVTKKMEFIHRLLFHLR